MSIVISNDISSMYFQRAALLRILSKSVDALKLIRRPRCYQFYWVRLARLHRIISWSSLLICLKVGYLRTFTFNKGQKNLNYRLIVSFCRAQWVFALEGENSSILATWSSTSKVISKANAGYRRFLLLGLYFLKRCEWFWPLWYSFTEYPFLRIQGNFCLKSKPGIHLIRL